MGPAAHRSGFVNRPDAFRGFLFASVGAHVVVVALLLGVDSLSSGPPVDLGTPVSVMLRPRGNLRDARLLPRKEESPPRAAESSPESNARSLAEAIAHVSAGEQPWRPGQSLREAIAQASRSSHAEGVPDGGGGSDTSRAGDPYFADLAAAVKEHYDVTALIPSSERKGLRAMVRLRVGRAGELRQVELFRASTNARFDEAVVAAVKKSAPFSPPPDRWRAVLETEGVLLQFAP